MLVLVLSLLLCACANVGANVVGKEIKASPTSLGYETYVDLGNYFINLLPLRWADASEVCRTYNGHLAFPKTQDEADELWTIMLNNNILQAHAGFHDLFAEGEYYTVKGRPMNETSFNTWSAGFPIGGAELNCGGLRGGDFMDLDCDSRLPSVCEANGPRGDGGFLDYKYIAGHGYFKYYEDQVSWYDAMKVCQSQGSHLWIPNSQEEKVAIFENYKLNYVWSGVHQLYTARKFFTIFDEPLESTGYNFWMRGEPSGTSTEYPYLVMTYTGYKTENKIQPFMCEYNPSD